MKTSNVILTVLSLLAAEFVLHHQITRMIMGVAFGLGLMEVKVQPRPVIPEGAVQSNEFAFVFEGIPALPVQGATAGVNGVPDQPGFGLPSRASWCWGPTS